MTERIGLGLVVVALLACTTRVDQSVIRYRLDLTSPHAAKGLACWDACQKESYEVYRSWCIGKCPGVERTEGEACQVDAREQPREMCMTRVSEYRHNDEAQAFVKDVGKGVAVGAARALDQGAENAIQARGEETGDESAQPARVPAQPAEADTQSKNRRSYRSRPAHRPATPGGD
jgi:hypothetical protein